MDIDAAVRYYEKDLIEAVKRIVAIRSVEGEPKDGMPFGEGPAKVLNEALNIADRMGFETKNLDNYCGYAQIGSGEDIIGLDAHLDILPADYAGDGHISFGIFNGEGGPLAREWIAGNCREVMIDLNVDGPIYKFINAINNYDDLVAKKCGK